MSKQKFKVVREHQGDRAYREGDIRIANKADVAHLVPHVLEPLDEEVEEKAETSPLNKAENAAPANKAASSRKSKAED